MGHEKIDWVDGIIPDCLVNKVKIYGDHRGSVMEIFRLDELDPMLHPAMCYLSTTIPGIMRGPHEHKVQTDYFGILFGKVRVCLWDYRKDSPTFGTRQVRVYGEDNPVTMAVPPGVVHGYVNIGEASVLILNCPNQLYAGPGRNEEVDEIRHEDNEHHPFTI